MQLINDREARMSYIRVCPDATVDHTRVIEEECLVIDFDAAGRIVGIELFDIVEEV